MKPTREQILDDVLHLLQDVARDWEYDRPLDASTRLFADLAFESLDLVVLGAAVQDHFKQTFPFAELFAELGQREERDLTIGEWVAYIEKHLQPGAAVAEPR
jgi:acyl carrier protein